MLLKQPSLFRYVRRCLLACVAAVGICAASPAISTEFFDPNTTTLTKLQSLTQRASELALRSMGLLGIHYRMGGNTPENGLDCSGLVRYVFMEAWGKTLPRTSEEMSRVGQNIDSDELQAGDLVFYNTLKRGFSHVGIYLGDNKFIHSPSSGGRVRIESMDLDYWKTRFSGARRISDPGRR
jgi:cell wall-associated NlpC family hydrolase